VRNSWLAPLGAAPSISLAIALAIILVPLAAAAAEEPGSATPDPAMAQFRAIDADGDGYLSGAELTGFQRKVFDALDEDADGQFDLGQLIAILGRQAEEKGLDAARRALMEERWVARFTGVDMNGDGIVTREEFELSHARRFASKDRDGDGRLSRLELGEGGL
jgi:Ca2+-binding EF-hand superfamily protein